MKRDWPSILTDAKQRGLTCCGLARELGVTPSAVGYACARVGVELALAYGGEPTIVAAYQAIQGHEEWRVIPFTEGRYEASSEGCVRETKTGKVLKPAPTRKGYQQVGVWFKGKRRSVRLHRLIALAFISNPDGLPEVNHDDLNKTNNRPGNLEWATRRGNQDHARARGLYHAPTNPRRQRRLTVEDVTSIRARAANESTKQIAADYPQVSDSHVYNVIKGKKRKRG